MTNGNGWAEWSRHVLAELERHDNRDTALTEALAGVKRDAHKELESFKKEIRDELAKINKQVTILTVKSGLLGFVAGVVGALIPVIIALLMGRL